MNCPISLSVCKHLHTQTHTVNLLFTWTILDKLDLSFCAGDLFGQRQLNAFGFFRLKPEHQTQSTDGGASRASQLLWKAELLVEPERIDDFCGFLCFKVFKLLKGNIGNGWKWFGDDWRGFQYPIEIPSGSVDGNSPVSALDQMDIDLLNPDAREVMQQ